MSKDPRAIEPLGPNENIPSFLLGGGSGNNKPKGASFVVPAGTENVPTGTRQDVIPEMPKRRSEREDVPSGFSDQFKPPPPSAAPAQKERRVTFAEEKQLVARGGGGAPNSGSSTYDTLQPYFPWIAAAAGILGFYYYYNYYQPTTHHSSKSRK